MTPPTTNKLIFGSTYSCTIVACCLPEYLQRVKISYTEFQVGLRTMAETICNVHHIEFI